LSFFGKQGSPAIADISARWFHKRRYVTARRLKCISNYCSAVREVYRLAVYVLQHQLCETTFCLN